MANSNCKACPAAPARRHRRWRLPVAAWIFLVVAAGVLVLDILDARAEVYHSRESALELAFPEADSVTTRVITLSGSQVARVVERAGSEPEARVVRVYEAWKDGSVCARGLIDTHRVRSLPETLFVVTDSNQQVEAVHLLAFHEPVQYRATDRWFAQFEGRALDTEMALRRGVAGIAGATMTANAVTAAVRRCVAILEVEFDTHSRLSAADTGEPMGR